MRYNNNKSTQKSFFRTGLKLRSIDLAPRSGNLSIARERIESYEARFFTKLL